MAWKALAATILAQSTIGPEQGGRDARVVRRRLTAWERLISEPRNAVLFVLGSVILIGGGRRVLNAWRARVAVRRLEGAGALPPEAFAKVVEHGRSGLMELFRLFGSGETEALRHQAGQAISVLWSRDELIAEEEKALVSRGWSVGWRARKRYPRALRSEVPFGLNFGVSFLSETGPGVRPSNLEWCYRVVGAKRASLEIFGPWKTGPMLEQFTIVPTDFDTNGPHRLVLQARVRTTGLTDSWQQELPHMPFSFEFDPRMTVESLLALPDEGRADEMAKRLSLRVEERHGDTFPAILNETWAIRTLPEIVVEPPLPCDLAHGVEVEIEGAPGRFPAGWQVITEKDQGPGSRVLPLGPVERVPKAFFEKPGIYKMRAIFSADPDRGWADPDVRSIWPGTITTDWVSVEVIRR